MTIFHAVAKFVSRRVSAKSKPLPQNTGEPDTARSRTILRTTSEFLSLVREDLVRPHALAHERVGFITVRAAKSNKDIVLLTEGYYPVADEEYIEDSSVGAMIGQEALRKGLELALLKRVGVFHVHMHGLSRRLWFSGTDIREQNKFVPDFFAVCPQMPHGAIVLNSRTAAGRVWWSSDKVTYIDEFDVVGTRMVVTQAHTDGSTDFYA